MPDVEHRDDLAGAARDGQEEARLRAPGDVRPEARLGARPPAGVPQVLPRPLQRLRAVEARLVRPPPRAAGTDQVVPAALLADGLRLGRCVHGHPHAPARVVEEVLRQLVDVRRPVLLRREDVVGPAVVVHEERHVAAHRAVRTQRALERERSLRTVRHRDPRARRLVALPLQLQVEEHHVLPRLRAVNHLRALDDAAVGDVALRILRDGERDAPVVPVHEVRRGVDVGAHVRLVPGAPVDLVLAVPPVGAAVEHHAAAVRVDDVPRRVVPQGARADLVLPRQRPDGAQRRHDSHHPVLHLHVPLLSRVFTSNAPRRADALTPTRWWRAASRRCHRRRG